MAANGISTLGTKALKQVAKLNYAQRKLQGYQVSGTNGSVSFNGTSQYLTVADAVPLRLVSATAWTIECWIYYTGSGSGSILVKDGVQGVNVPAYELHVSSGYVRGTVSSVGATQQILISSTLLPTNAWTHIAFVLNSGTYTLYQNGVSVATAAVVQTVGNFAPGALYIGYQDSGSAGAYISANISNVRIVKGTALYTTAFTPPSGRLPLVANTSLLLNTVYGSNFLVDSSTNAYTVTNNGTATSLSFSPITTNTANTNAVFYSARNTYDITQLPTQYNGNSVTDNANTGGLVTGRPWTAVASISIRALLGGSGQTAYDAASSDAFFAVSSTDYDAVVAGVSSVSTVGPTNAQFASTSGSSFDPAYIVTYPVAAATVPASNYILGFKATTDYANQQWRIYGGTTFKSTSPVYSQISTSNPSTGAGAPGIGTFYYLRKAPAVQAANTYIGIYGTQTLTMTESTAGTFTGGGYTSAPFTAWNNYTTNMPKVQVIITPTAVV